MTALRQNQINKYRAYWEYFHAQSVVATVPVELQIARSNICNFKCVYCSDHRDGNTIPRSRNEGATWEQLLHLIPRVDRLSFHGVSEFMVDPEFFDIIDRCGKACSSLFINTNGSVCGPRYLEALRTYPGSLGMSFSLDAATPGTYLRIRGQRFERILDNIRHYVSHLASRREPTWFGVTFVITKTSVHELADFVRLANSLKMDQVKFYRLHEYSSLDWSIPTKAGDIFDYRSEWAGEYREAFNRNLDAAFEASKQFSMDIELPARFPEPLPGAVSAG